MLKKATAPGKRKPKLKKRRNWKKKRKKKRKTGRKKKKTEKEQLSRKRDNRVLTEMTSWANSAINMPSHT